MAIGDLTVDQRSAVGSSATPAVSVLCGVDFAAPGALPGLLGLDLRVEPDAPLKLLLDLPRGYAVRTLEGSHKPTPGVIAVTWNPCPDHLEDLVDLRPAALLSGEFFLRRDLPSAFAEVLGMASRGEQYRFTPGPRTALTPRERAALRYIVRGWSDRRIGERLCVREQSVKNISRRLYRKLGVDNHVQAALYYWGLWDTPD